VALVPVVWIFQAIPAAAQSLDVYINEIQVSTSGTDWEFFELQGVPGTDLSSLTLIGVESDLGSHRPHRPGDQSHRAEHSC
jgi:hypothetical protein